MLNENILKNKMQEFVILLKRHYLAIIFAGVVGLAMVAPQLIFIHDLGAKYQGIYMFNTDSETHYLARMQDVYDGHGWGNPFLYEYKDTFPSTAPTISEAILAYPGKIFNITVANLNLFYKFFLPFILFLLIYSFSFRLTKSHFWSIPLGLVILLGAHDIFSLPEVTNLLRWKRVDMLFAMYSRPVNPEFSSLFLWIYLHIFLTALNKVKLKWFLLLAVIFGLSFYIYLYTWTFFLALNMVMALIWFFLKKRDLCRRILLTSVLGSVIGLPVIFTMIGILRNQYYPIVSGFMKVVDSRAPNVSKMGILVSIIFLLYFFYSKKTKLDYLMLGLLAVTYIVTNQQLVTGIQLQPGHYYLNLNTPVYILILFWIGYSLNQRFPLRYFIVPVMILVSLSFASVFLTQQSAYINGYNLAVSQQKYAGILNWLDKNTQTDSVVLADRDITQLIPVYTHDNIYWDGDLVIYIVPPERFVAAFFLYLKLSKITPAEFDKGNFAEYGDQISAIYPDVMTVNKVVNLGDLSESYRRYYDESFADNLKKYRLDYFVWDKSINPLWNLQEYNNLLSVYRYDDLAIYKVI